MCERLNEVWDVDGTVDSKFKILESGIKSKTSSTVLDSTMDLMQIK